MDCLDIGALTHLGTSLEQTDALIAVREVVFVVFGQSQVDMVHP
jgi:hypothetical protein